MQDAGGGDGGPVVVDLCVSDAGVVVDDGVHEGVSHLRAAPLVLRFVWCRGAVLLALGPSDVAPPTAVRDVSDLLHVYVDERPGVWMRVTADRFTGRTIDAREPVQPRRGQDAVHGGRGDAESRGELNRSFP